MNVLKMIDDILQEDTGENRPHSPPIRPEETLTRQGDSPLSPLSPQEGVELQQDPFDFEISLAIQLFNEAGVNIMDYPAAVRHKALVLEEQMTEAANENDRGKFIELVMAWRKCFLH